MQLNEMSNIKRFMWVMGVLFVLIMILQISYDGVVSNNASIINIPKTEVKSSTGDLRYKSLKVSDQKEGFYRYLFDEQLFDRYSTNKVWLIIEKLNTQYFRVLLNGEIIAEEGDHSDGKANIWSKTFFVQIDRNHLQKENRLEFYTYSEYVSGIEGDLFFIEANHSNAIVAFKALFENISTLSINIAIFSSMLLMIFFISFKKTSYNFKGYFYYALAMFTMGLSMMDHSYIENTFIHYFTYKKIIILCYHLTSYFMAKSIIELFAHKRKLHFGHLSLSLVMIASVVAPSLIVFKQWYDWLNLLIACNIFYIIYIIYKNRFKEIVKSYLFIYALILCLVPVTKMLLESLNVLFLSNELDMSLILIIFVINLFYIVFNEYWMMSNQVRQENQFLKSQNESVMNTLGQGVLKINKDLKVVGNYSVICDHIFKRNIIGQDFPSLIYEKSNDETIFLKEVLSSLFLTNDFNQDGYISLLPEEIYIGNRWFNLKYQLEDADKKEKISLTIMISDISYIKELEFKLEKEKSERYFLINALKKKNELHKLVKTAESLIATLMTSNNEAKYDLDMLLNKIHTLKGNMAQFGMKNTELALHNIETEIEIYGIDYQHIGNLLIEKLVQDMNVLDAEFGSAFFENELVQESATNLKNLILGYNDYILDMGKQLDKKVNVLEVVGDDVYVVPQKVSNLIDTFVGVFRNSLVHGIESLEERAYLGKNLYGTIRVKLSRLKEYLTIEISDDGRGLDRERLIQQAIKLGMIDRTSDYELSETLLNHLVFYKEISTQSTVDLISGRGIGLSALRDSVQEMNGNVRVVSKWHEGFKIEITIPISEVEKWLEF